MRQLLFRSVIFFCVLLPIALQSQQQTATLKITVLDQAGSIIPKATATVRNLETGATRSEHTEEAGPIVIAGLPAGSYELAISAGQFTPYKQPLKLAVGQIASLNVTLGITVKEIVDVTATAQAIDTEKSEVSEVIETRKITDLPVSGRDFIDFVLLTPRPTSAAVRPSARNHRSLRPCSKSVSAACAKLIAPSSLSTALITPPAFPVCSTSVLPRIGCRNSG